MSFDRWVSIDGSPDAIDGRVAHLLLEVGGRFVAGITPRAAALEQCDPGLMVNATPRMSRRSVGQGPTCLARFGHGFCLVNAHARSSARLVNSDVRKMR